MRSDSQVAALPRRDRLIVWVCLLLITALAWAYLIHLERQMSASMTYDTMMAKMGMALGGATEAWTTTDVFFTFIMWVVMMVGMMAATAAPVLLLFSGARRGRGDGSVGAPVFFFGLGYILVWVGFSGAAALAQWALHLAALLSPAMATTSARVAGAILVTAGVYQWMPMKGACLTKCQSPLGFLMSHWRDGSAGALQMGLRHGVFCLGCCWALMLMLFAVGVMNLAWVAALTVLVFLEKVGPTGVRVARAAGVILIVAGLSVFSGLT